MSVFSFKIILSKATKKYDLLGKGNLREPAWKPFKICKFVCIIFIGCVDPSE